MTVKNRNVSLVLVALAAVLPYLNALDNGFVWDDRPLIVQDYRIKNVAYAGRLFRGDFFEHVDETVKYGYYRPAVSLSYMLDHHLWGERPFGYHLTNVILHALNSLLVLVLAGRLLGGRPGVALAAALVFAVHPVHTESVTWIAGRTDLLATLFTLAALLSLDSYCGNRKREGLLALSLALYFLAMLAKESAVILPAAAALYLTLYRRGGDAAARRRIVGGYAAVAVLYLVFRFGVAMVNTGSSAPLSLAQRLLSCASTFLLYMRRMAFPVNLCAYITNPPARSLLDPRVLGGAVLLAAALFAAARAWRRERGIAFFILFALLSLIPAMNVIRISAPADMGFPAAERFLYMPSIGLIVAACAAAAAILKRRAVRAGLTIAVVASFSLLTAARNPVWRNEETLFSDALLSNPRAPLLWNNLGIYYSRSGRHEEAEECIGHAIGIEGPNARLLNNLAVAKRERGLLDEALALLEKAQRMEEPLARTYFNLAMVHERRGESDKADEAFRRAIERNPADIETLSQMARLQERLGRFGEAERYYRRALSLHPSSAPLWSNLGVAFKQAGKLGEARKCLERAVSLDPGLSTARGNLGVVLAQQGEYRRAFVELAAARRLDPGNLDAANATGVLLAKTGSGAEAEALFRELVRDHPGDPEAYINMGILRYGQGNIAKARRWFERALGVDPGNARAKSYLDQLGAGE